MHFGRSIEKDSTIALSLFKTAWRFPIEGDTGELQLQILQHDGTLACLDLRAFHLWHCEAWPWVSVPERVEVPISLVRSPPDTHDVRVFVTLWDAAVPEMMEGQFCARAQLPQLDSLAGSRETPLLLQLRALDNGSCGSLQLTASWNYPLRVTCKDGSVMEQRGKG